MTLEEVRNAIKKVQVGVETRFMVSFLNQRHSGHGYGGCPKKYMIDSLASFVLYGKYDDSYSRDPVQVPDTEGRLTKLCQELVEHFEAEKARVKENEDRKARLEKENRERFKNFIQLREEIREEVSSLLKGAGQEEEALRITFNAGTSNVPNDLLRKLVQAYASVLSHLIN